MKKLILILIMLALASANLSAADSLHVALKETDFSGGLIVVLGCDDAEGIAALSAENRIIQVLDTDAHKVAHVKKYLASKKLGRNRSPEP